jgi:hypothetical protein
MVFEQSSSSESFSNLGSTLDRFICIGTQSTDRDILLLESPWVVIPEILVTRLELLSIAVVVPDTNVSWAIAVQSVKFDNGIASYIVSEARKLLSASWRKGTQKDYCSKFKQFNSWCCSRQIDPNSISLSQIADFLTYLYIEKGLQYRTIAGYHSMLSTVLPTVDNFPGW